MVKSSEGLIDLHVHTDFSEGGFGRPEEAVRKAAQLGLRAISLTEHDNLGSIPAAAEAAAKFGIEYVTGVEITTHNRRRAFCYHLLAYMFDPEHPALVRLMEKIRRAIEHNIRRTLEVYERDGIGISWPLLQEATARLYPDLPGRAPDWHVLNLTMVERGAAPSIEAADSLRIEAFKRAGRIVGYPEQELVLETVKKAGGLAFMAHPQGFIRNHFAPETILAELIADGLDGVEAYSPKHDKETERFYRALAKKVGCVVSGGSDCHDVRRPIAELPLGRRRVPYLVLRRMVARHAMKYGAGQSPAVRA